MAKKKIDNKQKAKPNKRKMMNKIIVFTMAGMMLLSTVAGTVTTLMSSNDNYETYLEKTELALEQATKVKNDTIGKIVEKQTKDKDYSLDTMIDLFGSNPAYISLDYKVYSDNDKVEKQLDKLKNKKYSEDDMIELVWKTDDDNLVTTYIASDIKDEVKVVGLLVNDLSITASSIKDNKKVSKTDTKFEDIANLDLSLAQIEEKVGSLHTYNIQYPLLAESKTVQNSLTEKDDAKYLMANKMVRTENSTIVVSTKDDKVLSIREVLDNYDKITKLDKETFTKVSENEKLKEEEFLSLVKEAKLTSVELVENEDNKSVKQNSYLIKDSEGEVNSIVFKDGAFNNIEPID